MATYARVCLLIYLFSLSPLALTVGQGMPEASADEGKAHASHPSQSSISDSTQPTSANPSQVTGTNPSAADQERAKKELEALRQKPEEFRTLVTGVQVFLGRFGYGVGPYHGTLDQQTKNALKAYQEHIGLEATGDIDYATLKSLTEDDQVLNRVIPYLPPYAIKAGDWQNVVEVQGSWMLKEGNTDDVLETSRILCSKVLGRCIDSTASLVNSTVPTMRAHTDIYEIKEWNEHQIVSHPYEGEPCAVSILRIFQKPVMVTRFVSTHSNPSTCRKVKPADHQYVLDDGPKIYQSLKAQKAKAIQEILQVKHEE
ncbi:MAG: peptidoglycan-binding protein [Nitrospirales bacterium]|nr:peptidoglycan-binding protein [Nitrospirales bacterium]